MRGRLKKTHTKCSEPGISFLCVSMCWGGSGVIGSHSGGKEIILVTGGLCDVLGL